MNVDPEVTLLTSLLVDNNGIVAAASIVRPEDFKDDWCRNIFRAIVELGEIGKPADTLHVLEYLVQTGMSQAEAIVWLDRATDGCPLPGQAKHYAIRIHEDARKRKLSALMESTKARAEQGGNAEDIARDALEGIWNIQADKAEKDVQPMSAIAPQVLNETAAMRHGDTEHFGVKTGISELDLTTRGICASEFWVIGAMPGRGKTALATQIAVNASSSGVPVLFFSLEMTAGQLFRRILGMQFGASLVRNPSSLSIPRWEEMTEFAGEIAGYPLYVEDSSSLSASELSLKARQAIRQHGIKLIIVDYLQLLRGNGRELRERVGNSANVLRQLAKDTGIPVVSLSQLRRPGDLNDTPTMIDLKESGDIEAHANTVLLIYMPQGEDRQPLGEEEIIIGKQRNGPVGSIPVYFDKRTLTFKPRAIGASA